MLLSHHVFIETCFDLMGRGNLPDINLVIFFRLLFFLLDLLRPGLHIFKI